jgi:hypothetical protein
MDIIINSSLKGHWQFKNTNHCGKVFDLGFISILLPSLGLEIMMDKVTGGFDVCC